MVTPDAIGEEMTNKRQKKQHFAIPPDWDQLSDEEQSQIAKAIADSIISNLFEGKEGDNV